MVSSSFGMAQRWQLDVKVFQGPSLFAPFPAVVVEVPDEVGLAVPPAEIEAAATALLPAGLIARIGRSWGDGRFEEVAATLAGAVQDLAGPTGLPADVRRDDLGRCRVSLGFHDPQVAVLAIQTGFNLASAVRGYAAGRAGDRGSFAAILEPVESIVRSRQPDRISQPLIREARSRGIPVLSVSPGSRVWQYGHGRAGFQFFEASNHRDSKIGSDLSHHKILSNQLVTRLGLPGVVQGVADSAAAASREARRIGFPVVVKPVDSAKSYGVTVNVTTEEELARAFASARGHTRRGAVVVERQVSGENVRLVAIGGRFSWAYRRTLPRVVGDGRHTIMELVEIENRSRGDANTAVGSLRLIPLDEEMRETLRKQGFAPGDRPPEGVPIPLRGTANIGTGATVTDCSCDVHPDVRDMAETIARAFHLDAVGIDFMTGDIRASWRDVECAVLEVNGTPSIESDARAALILEDKFPGGGQGRIPSAVLVGADARIVERAASRLGEAGLDAGWTDGGATGLGGRPRFSDARTLPERVTGLLLDPACEALVIAATPDEIRHHGFPLDRCDLALLPAVAPLDEPIRRLIEDCAAEVIEGVAEDDVGREVETRLAPR